MRNQLIISDLNYLYHVTETTAVFGCGVYADAVTTTKTGKGSAESGAGAVATGMSTFTEAVTLTDVTEVGIATLSRADASAKAYAKTGYTTALSSSFKTSLSLYITSP